MNDVCWGSIPLLQLFKKMNEMLLLEWVEGIGVRICSAELLAGHHSNHFVPLFLQLSSQLGSYAELILQNEPARLSWRLNRGRQNLGRKSILPRGNVEPARYVRVLEQFE